MSTRPVTRYGAYRRVRTCSLSALRCADVAVHGEQALLPDMVTYSSPVSFLQAFTRPEGSRATAPLMGAFSVANNHSADMGPRGCDPPSPRCSSV